MDVQVIKASDEPIIRGKRTIGSPLKLERKRVAAYVRVSTDGEEQLQSFNSQKQYYQDKISKNKDWVMVGIYADEGITGTKTKNRDDFLRMIDDCMKGYIDIVLTKSISRFSRNLVDTIQYVRMLKQKGVTVIFEKENINTSTMESEMQLALLSTLAQNEVESLSANVKLGVKMKMGRGELMGFNGCLGYDYHPVDKSITVNETEAEIVRFIYDKYIEGYGANTIAKELTRLGKINKKGECKWTPSGINGVLKNEKYKGDILQGKTYTVDPISKRRLDNRGEEDMYYIKDHHEPIVTREVWEKVQEIRESRHRENKNISEESRMMYARKYAFSRMCQCGFCGGNYTRRSHNQTRTENKSVWKCRIQSNKGVDKCPHSKAIDESLLENSFLDMFQVLADNFEDVVENVLNTVEESLANDDIYAKIKNIDKKKNKLENQRKKLTDLMLEEKISKNAYDEKYDEISYKLTRVELERKVLSENSINQKSIKERMGVIRSRLGSVNVLDKFDRITFESIVKKIIIGEEKEDGTMDPYKLTFVLRGMDNRIISNAKERYK